jgi:hypothetical protein
VHIKVGLRLPLASAETGQVSLQRAIELTTNPLHVAIDMKIDAHATIGFTAGAWSAFS